MDNALKFDKVAALPHDQYNRVPADLVDPPRQPLVQTAARPTPSSRSRTSGSRSSSTARPGTRSRSTRTSSRPSSSPTTTTRKAEDEKAKKDKKKKKYTEREAWESDFYNDEVVRIVADYLTLGSKVLAATPVKAAANQ